MDVSDKRVDRLLDLIYDAATEQELWRSVLTEIADLTKSQGGVLFGQSVRASKVYFEFNGRLSEECNRVYRERHMQNLWSMGMESRPVGRIVLSDEIIPLSSLRPTLFFEEVLRPQDVAHNVMIALAAKDDFCAAFNLCRSVRQGDLGRDERGLLGRLVSHLQRAFLLGFRLDAYRALQCSEYQVLDQLSVGSFSSIAALGSSTSIGWRGPLTRTRALCSYAMRPSRRCHHLIRNDWANSSARRCSERLRDR
jgi:hypothetical protein